jgi:hypothetical protein
MGRHTGKGALIYRTTHGATSVELSRKGPRTTGRCDNRQRGHPSPTLPISSLKGDVLTNAFFSADGGAKGTGWFKNSTTAE